MLFIIVIDDKPIIIEVDTGACETIMSEDKYRQKFSKNKLITINNYLKTVIGETLYSVGKFRANVEFNCKRQELDISVVSSKTYFKVGRNWMDIVFPLWRNTFEAQEINSVNESKVFLEIKNKFKNISNEKLNSPIVGFKADILIKDNSVPIFYRPYTVPYLLRTKVEEELNRLVEEKIIFPVKYSNWASPMVVIPKPNGEIRICMDCKVTLNKVIQTEHHPLPKIKDIFASLSGSAYFCVIDLKGAYTQLAVSQQCQSLLTINTHKGLFTNTRLPFGLSSAPSIFQSIMDRILQGLPNVYCYLDDILIGSATIENCKRTLFDVLKRLEEHNIRINFSKCKLLENSVNYLGHTLCKNGVKPNKDKVKAIVEAPAPQNLKQLQAYLGLLNYYN